MARLARRLGALTVLVGLLVGVPLLLLWLGATLPQPARSGGLVKALLRPDDGSVLLWLVAAVGWLAWASFAVSVLTELVSVATRQRVRITLPGLAAPRRLAAGLIVAVLALSVAPALPHPPVATSVAMASGQPEAPSTPPPGPERPARTLATDGSTARGPATTGVSSASAAADHEPAAAMHIVRPGDDLWSLAEQYYGEGRQWRQIAAANPGLLTGGPDRLVVGWRLQVPDATEQESAGESVRVRRGDSLSQIAERELGTAERWPEIYRANRAQLSDPDQLAPGTRLVLPEGGSDSSPESGPARQTVGGGETRPESAERPARVPTRRAQPADGGVVPSAAQPGGSASERAGGPATAPAPSSPVPASPAPSSPVPSPAAPASSAPSSSALTDDPVEQADGVEAPALALALVGVGGLLAAGVIAGLGRRRRLQLQARPVGRRIIAPAESSQPVEVALGRRQRPLTLRSLDRALRAIGAHAREQAGELPVLQLVLVGEDRITLWMADADTAAPPPFRTEGRCWSLDAADAPYLASVPGIEEALRPWPTLVTLGRDDQDRQVLAELEGVGLLQLQGGDADAVEALLTALAVELSFSPWAEEMVLTLVGAGRGLPAALGQHNVSAVDDVDQLLDRLERRAVAQREHRAGGGLARYRLDPDLGDAWTPEVVLVADELPDAQRRRLHALVTETPAVTTAAVVVGGPAGAGWALDLGSGAGPADLTPAGIRLTPQRLERAESASVLELVEATSRTDTEPAPWWAADAPEPAPPPDNVTYLGRRFGGWVPETREGDEMATDGVEGGSPAEVDHPTLLLLGPVELLGAAGTPPPRASKQCLEYCAWLLEHPGRSAQGMASALAVAEGTRRSNMSRLRTWLGESPDGKAYLPDAYTGRIVLHPAVSSDWERLRVLTVTGVNRSSTDALRAALGLVRGAPLADAAPGQWHWAEELRTDMISCLRDVGVELTQRALVDQDLDLARWAAARALVAAPGDELLLAARIRTEHLAGNAADTERLSLQLAAQARQLGVDLDPQTVTLLQEVVEGRVRARLA